MTAPATPRNIPHRGAPANPSAAALAAHFGAEILRSDVVWGETTVFVTRRAIHDVIRWLHDDHAQCYEYLVDVTAWDPLESTCRHASLSIL